MHNNGSTKEPDDFATTPTTFTAVGANIKRLRADILHETQAVFGDRFGVEQATVSRWERGCPVGNREVERAIAELAGISVAQFFHSDEGARLIPVEGQIRLGGRIRNARLAARLTKTALAKRIGVSRTAVGQWEKDETLPRKDNILAMAKELGVPPHTFDLFGGDQITGEAQTRLTKDEIWALINHYCNAMRTDHSGHLNGRMSKRAMDVEQHAQRIAELCKQVYHLEKRDEDDAAQDVASNAQSPSKWWERLDAIIQNGLMSIEDVALRAGVPSKSLYGYLKGEVENPRGDVLQKLAHAVGTTELALRYGDAAFSLKE